MSHRPPSPSFSSSSSTPCSATFLSSSARWHHTLTIPSRPPSPFIDPPSSPHPLLGSHPLPSPTYTYLPSPQPSPAAHLLLLPTPQQKPPTRPPTKQRRTWCRVLIGVLCIAVVGFYTFVILQSRFLHTAFADVPWGDYSTPDILRDGVSVASVPQDEQWLRTQRVVICGLLRDKEGQVAYLQRALPRITSLFADWALVVVENNSTDNTRERLLEWQQHDTNHIHVLAPASTTTTNSNDSTAAESPVPMFRTVRHDYTEWRIRKMAALRNSYMAYVSSHAALSQYELLVVMDLDLQSFLYTDGLLSTAHHLHTNHHIAAIAANGQQLTTAPLTAQLLYGFEYQDPYAHEDERNAGKGLAQQLDNVRSKFVNRFQYGDELRAVRSAFGGFAVYRMERVVGLRYGVVYSDSGGHVLCEHVSLNRQLAAGGGGMFVNPSMMHVIVDNRDGYVDRRNEVPLALHPLTTHVANVDSEAVDLLLATI